MLQVIPEHCYKNEELVLFLDELLVTNNHVKKMQPYIDLCENLTKLVIHDNLVKKFPPAFTQLQKLKHLDFGGNLIKKFPGNLFKIDCDQFGLGQCACQCCAVLLYEQILFHVDAKLIVHQIM